MEHVLPELPYDKKALEPHISAETLEYHHGKHHKAYVDNLNNLQKGTEFESKTLEEIVKTSSGGIYNNAAQIWNHTFFWHCLSPEGQSIPGSLEERIKADFGSVADFKDKLKAEAVGHFGSGWAWLVLNGDKLEITSLHDADSPVAHDGMKPLLTLDVWEHAYYIDYRNARPDYLSTVLDKAINWEFVAQNLDGKGTERADQEG